MSDQVKPRWCESTFRSYSYFWERSMVNNRVALRLQFLKLDHPPPPLSTFRIPTFGHCSVKVLRSLLPALHATFLFYLFAPHLFLKYKAYVTTPEGGLLSN